MYEFRIFVKRSSNTLKKILNSWKLYAIRLHSVQNWRAQEDDTSVDVREHDPIAFVELMVHKLARR